MRPEELRLEYLRLAARPNLLSEWIAEDAERYMSFVNGYRFTRTDDGSSDQPSEQP